MKRILVPTDFSTHAENALKVAAQIAKETKSEIHLLHVLEIPNQMNDAISVSADIPEIMLFIKKGKETLNKLKEKSYLKGITVTESEKLGKPFQGIISYINENDTDLIVMGSKGSSGIEEILIGSNTEKIVRLSDTPVLVIKEEIANFNPKKIVFASDFSEEIKKPFKKMIAFADLFNAELSLTTICTPNSFKPTPVAKKIMSDFAADANIKKYSSHIYNDTNIEKGIVNFSNEVDADLIGLCTHGRTGLAHFFTGSISEDLVNHSVKPVIVFKI